MLLRIAFLSFFSSVLLAEHKQTLFCDILIIGGGPGGVHTAYQLSKIPNQNLCLIEKEDHLGGRIYDLALDPKQPELLYGLGALRVMQTQSYVLALAKEIGVQLEFAPYRDDLISARGFFSFSSDEINQLAYPWVSKEFSNSTGHGTEDAFYDKLLHGPERKNAINYPDFRSYVRSVLGTQAHYFLPEVFRFKAEFEYPIDARSYLDYLDEEMENCCQAYYPIGGMSAFIRQMIRFSQNHGIQIFTSETAQTISKLNQEYLVVTPHYQFVAKRLIIATNAHNLKHIQGDIADRINEQKQTQDIMGIKVVSIAQKWPYNWWKDSGYAGKDIHRAWTTEHCLSFIEIPINPYAADQNVTRSVYDDDMRCVTFWENTYYRLGIQAVEAEIERGLRYLFPKADIPKPLRTVVQIWPTAWFYLRAGTQYSNQKIAEWALRPLANEAISLVGDSYWIQRSGWCDAAYQSSIHTLNQNYGLHIRPLS